MVVSQPKVGRASEEDLTMDSKRPYSIAVSLSQRLHYDAVLIKDKLVQGVQDMPYGLYHVGMSGVCCVPLNPGRKNTSLPGHS